MIDLYSWGSICLISPGECSETERSSVMKVCRFLRSSLCVVLVVAFLMGMVPTAFAADRGNRKQVTVDASHLPVSTDERVEEEDSSVLNALYEATGITPVEEEDSEFGTPQNIDPEGKGATKSDQLSTSYVLVFHRILLCIIDDRETSPSLKT